MTLTEYFENYANERATECVIKAEIYMAITFLKLRHPPEDIALGCRSLPMSFIKNLTPDMTVDEAYALFKSLALVTA
ncbi:MAG: hypothetical protein LBT59_27095 [Clostridiales bacterium]|jgi:hypothetical protein|nr:hypothetical protein [Clostridiales bacterium]